MIVKTNVAALNSLNSAKRVEIAQSKVLGKIASGKRINTAADDAVGTAMREAKESLIRGSEQASRNTQDGISLTQTAQGGIDVIQSMAHRMRELAVQSANDALTSEDRQKIQEEIKHINEQITKTAEQTTFNGKNLLAAEDSKDEGLVIHVSSQPSVQVIIERSDITAEALGTDKVDLTTAESANEAIGIVEKAVNKIATEQTKYGSYQSRFDQIAGNLGTVTENATASQSRIVDADMAAETLELAKYNILSSSTNAMLANANQRPETVLSLINA